MQLRRGVGFYLPRPTKAANMLRALPGVAGVAHPAAPALRGLPLARPLRRSASPLAARPFLPWLGAATQHSVSVGAVLCCLAGHAAQGTSLTTHDGGANCDTEDCCSCDG